MTLAIFNIFASIHQIDTTQQFCFSNIFVTVLYILTTILFQ